MTDYRIELAFDFASVNTLSVTYFNPGLRACLLQDGVVNLDRGNTPDWYTGWQVGDTLAFDLFDVTVDAVNADLSGGPWKRQLLSFGIFFGNPLESVMFSGGLAPVPASPASSLTDNPVQYTPPNPYTTQATATSYVFGGQQYPHYPVGNWMPQNPLRIDTSGKYVLAVQALVRDTEMFNLEKIFAMDPEPIVGPTSVPP